MPLPQLQYPPPTENGWKEWSFQHKLHHIALIDAIKEQKGIILNLPLLEPVNPEDESQMQVWARGHQSIHDAMNAIYDVPGFDLQELDMKDRTKKDSWFFSHLELHKSIAALCGQPV